MRVVLVNGSPRRNGNTAAALFMIEQVLLEHKIDTQWFQIGTQPAHGCIACNKCRKTNRCAFEDDICNALLEAIIHADGVIIGSPVYFAAPNGALCAILDRVFYASTTYSQLFKGKLAAALTTCEATGGTAALDRLHRYFIPSQMLVVTSNDYTVFPGNSVLHGNEKALDVLQHLGDNMVAQMKLRFSEEDQNS